MPECYTHVHIATQALMRGGFTVASNQAFIAGANGPDPLYMYRIFKRRREPDLPALAKRMHTERTGAFLNALMAYAITPTRQSFVLGYLCHYITDCTIYPFIAAMTMSGGPYAGAGGACHFEAQLDSTLYHQAYKSYLPPLEAGTPVLIGDELAEVTSLLHEVIREVYKLDVSQTVLAECYHENLEIRKRLTAKGGLGRAMLRWRTPKKDIRGQDALQCRMQPAGQLKALPEHWTNPYSKEEMYLSVEEMVQLAVQTSAACVTAAMQFWLGELDDESMVAILGDNNFYTGQPNPVLKKHPPREQGRQGRAQ